jgi:glycosyltransferase involved in cell wall biosynthesis
VRVLLATRAFPPDQRGSASTMLFELWDRLRERHDVRVVAGWRKDPSLLPADAVAVRWPEGRSLKARAALELAVRRTALTFRPDVVLAWGIEVPSDVAPTVGLLGDPFAGASSWGRLGSLRKRLWKQRVGGMVSAVVPNEAAKARLAAFGLDPKKVTVCWPGLDTARLCPDPLVEAVPREGPLRVVYAARMAPGKAQHAAIEAIKGLSPQLRDRIELDLIGRVEDSDYVAGLARRASGAPVTFHHDVPDVAPLLRRAHLALFPTTLDEPFGFSALEAMACGKPVVHSRSAALRELTGDVGVDVPSGDVKQLGMAIRSVLRDPPRAKELGERGRELVLERYAWSTAYDRYEALLQEAAR